MTLLKRHVLTHSGEKLFRCEKCGNDYSTASNLKQHMMTHTGERPFECEQCDKRFSTRGNLKIHVQRRHKGARPFSCNQCDTTFAVRSSLDQHLLECHSKDLVYKCHECELRFYDQGGLRRHEASHGAIDKQHRCEQCNRMFFTAADLEQHIESHTRDYTDSIEISVSEDVSSVASVEEVRIYAANVSAERVQLPDSDDDDHLTVASSDDVINLADGANDCDAGIRLHTCPMCDETLETTDELQRHMLTHHGTRRETASKDSCPYLNCSALPDAGENPYRCVQCGENFGMLSDLQRHLSAAHSTDGKLYHCRICSHSFTLFSSLKRHMILHTGDTPYKCDLCARGFTASSSLKQHLVSHSGVKPYECDRCEKRFTQLGHLRTHSFVQHGRKPLKDVKTFCRSGVKSGILLWLVLVVSHYKMTKKQ